jgi:hypothetical protein
MLTTIFFVGFLLGTHADSQYVCVEGRAVPKWSTGTSALLLGISVDMDQCWHHRAAL